MDEFEDFVQKKLSEYGYSLQQIFYELTYGDDENARDIVEEIVEEWTVTNDNEED
jgi:uncharacterized protein YecA (UPF0149 family)